MKEERSGLVSVVPTQIEVEAFFLEDPQFWDDLAKLQIQVLRTYKLKGRVLVAGTGAAELCAQQLVQGLMHAGYENDAPLFAHAISLQGETFASLLASFVQQCRPNDLFIAISISGFSPILLECLQICKRLGGVPAALTGKSGGKMTTICDICLRVPTVDTPRILDTYGLIGEMLCMELERSVDPEMH
jgi:D-sedoheptulose 7-phosphate isomerase